MTVAKLPSGCPPTRWVGLSSRHQLGVLGLELRQPAHHPVEFAVADLRRRLDIIEIIMTIQLLAQLGDLVLDLLACHGQPHLGGFGLDRAENQGSSTIASTPVPSMTTNLDAQRQRGVPVEPLGQRRSSAGFAARRPGPARAPTR